MLKSSVVSHLSDAMSEQMGEFQQCWFKHNLFSEVSKHQTDTQMVTSTLLLSLVTCKTLSHKRGIQKVTLCYWNDTTIIHFFTLLAHLV